MSDFDKHKEVSRKKSVVDIHVNFVLLTILEKLECQMESIGWSAIKRHCHELHILIFSVKG